MGGVCEGFPLTRIRVVRPVAPILAVPHLPYRELLPAASQQRPRMRALAAINLVPTAAVRRDGLLQIGRPELPVLREVAPKQPCAVRPPSQPLVYRHVDLGPRGHVVEGDDVLVGLIPGHQTWVRIEGEGEGEGEMGGSG